MRHPWVSVLAILSTIPLIAASSYEVKWVGEMRKVMMGEDQGIISLASLKGRTNLYALGPVEGLNGEITVLNGQPYIAVVRDGKPLVQKTLDVKAPLLVYAQVAKWSNRLIPSEIQSVDDLDKFVAACASSSGLDMTKPIPFMVSAHMHEIQMHIVNRQGRDVRGKEAHEAIEVRLPLTNENVELIGFRSDKHGGVFTHMGQNTHIHGVTTDGRLSGHVDSFKIGSGELGLPALN